MSKTTCKIDECDKVSKARGLCGMHAERVRRHGDPLAHGAFIRGDDELRFWSKVDKGAADECWRWQGTKARGGYGQFGTKDGRTPAHRYAYELLVGPIPEGMQLDHVWARGCSHRDCVNPAHLEPVTLVENVMRGNAYSAINARKTKCIRGHDFDKVIITPTGKRWRRCTICHAMKTAESKRRRRAQRAA